MGLTHTANIVLDIKKVFLSFAQAYFAEDTTYTWTNDFVTTKILIVDKNAFDIEVVEKRPAIVLSRNPITWAKTSIAQMADPHAAKAHNVWLDAKLWTDLARSSITFNCIAKNGIVAESLASNLFTAIPGFKDEFRINGIHKIHNVSLGEERMIKSDSDMTLCTVPVTVNFDTQRGFGRQNSWSVITAYVNNNLRLYDTDFWTPSGRFLKFYDPPESGSTISTIYTDAATLQEVSLTLTTDSNPLTYEYELQGLVYAVPPILSGFTFLGTPDAGITISYI